ncbi:unnamed protein product [Haemonchus placei]|uniref:Aquaporin n=1 Tax=Haemonchus placei TaxID=6290 RepID=A0A158QLQ5_HAEPC|nr:unnamed protein product [Haemonchus placei]
MDEFRERIGNTLRIEDNKLLRELLAECIGTFFLLLIGTAANVQAAAAVGGNSTSAHIAWGIGFMFAVYLAASVSGAHLNPAISVAQCILGNIPGWKVFLYSIAQLIGAYLGTAVSYFGHHDDLWKLDGGIRQVTGPQGTAGLFTTFPSSYMSTWGSLLDQVFTETLTTIFFFKNSQKTAQDPFWFRHGREVHCRFSNGGFAINPARDLGPRLFVLCAGYGWQVFSAYGFYFWIPIVGPLIGAVLGAWIYKLFVGLHGLSEELEVSSKGYNVSLPVYTSGDVHVKTRVG